MRRRCWSPHIAGSLTIVCLALNIIACSRTLRIVHLEPTWRTEYRLGIQAFEAARWEEAILHFEASLNSGGPHPSHDYRPHVYLAEALFALRRIDEAARAMDTALANRSVTANDPEYPRLMRLRDAIATALEAQRTDRPRAASERPGSAQARPPALTETNPREDFPRTTAANPPETPGTAPVAAVPPQPLPKSSKGRRTPPNVTPPAAGPPSQPITPIEPAPPPASAPGGSATPVGGAQTGAMTSATPFEWVLLGTGVMFALVVVAAAVWIPSPTGFQLVVFRTVLALSVALSAASIPWFVGVPSRGPQVAGAAAGSALGLFLLVFLVDPVRRVRAAGGGRGAGPASHLAPARSIFISYRHADSVDIVDHLHERLVARFGKSAVFKDVDTLIPGLDFREELTAALQQCRMVLAVIGPQWVSALIANRGQVPEGSQDFVVLEIASALTRQIPVIPVLVHQATLPSVQELPPALASLRYRQALVLRSDPDFAYDIERLIVAIEQLLRLERT